MAVKPLDWLKEETLPVRFVVVVVLLLEASPLLPVTVTADIVELVG